MKYPREIIFLVGPTASGKSAVAAHLAQKLHAEVISCDSMQLYKGMRILASYPPPAALKKIKHHCIGVVPVTREYNVAAYRAAALRKIHAIWRAGKTPLFVGGTGFYVGVMLDGIFPEITQDAALRQRLYKRAEKIGAEAFHEELCAVDPLAAAKIHPQDTRRIVRALEVFQKTKIPISEWQKKRTGLWGTCDIRIFGIRRSRAALYRRIDSRVEEMFKQGLAVEVKKLLKRRLSRTAACAIGIREVSAYLDGDMGLEAAMQLMQRNTRRYAKRQMTWFRKEKRIEWIGASDKEKPQETACKILRKLKKSS